MTRRYAFEARRLLLYNAKMFYPRFATSLLPDGLRFMMRRISTSILAAVIAALFTSKAQAQFLAQPQQLPGTIRIQINFGGPLALTPGEDQKKQIENARLQIYENAKKECDQLTLSFDAHCKLLTLNVSVHNQVIGAVPAGFVNATAVATYELDPEAQTSPRRR